MPGTLRSSVYLPAPVVFSAASTMAVGLPMIENSALMVRQCEAFSLCLDRRTDRGVHLVVARATAQIAAQSRAQFCFRRIWVLRQERLDGHDETRRAISALCTAPVSISFLNCRQAPVLRHALYGCDLLSLTTRGQQSAAH